MADGTVKIGTELDESGLKKGLSGLGNFAKQGFSAIGGAASAMAKTSLAAIGAVSAGMAAAGTAALAVGQEFETSFAKASTLFGDVNVDTDGLKRKLLEVSDATGIAANELNESLYSALSAGIPATEDMSEATAFLESSAKLAKAGFTDMDTALSATAKTLNAYGLDVSEADRINKILIQTQNKGITTVDELGASLAQVTPTAAAFGVSFEQVGASLANMTAAGTPTAQATTQLNSLIAELGKQGTMGSKALQEAAKGTEYAGMSFNQMMAAGVPLNKVLDMMQKSADDSGKSMVDLFSSIEAGKAALALSGENSEKFAENLEAMGTSADVVTEAYDKVSNTLQNKVGKIQNSAKNLGIDIYNSVQEPLSGLADRGLEYMDQLSQALSEGGLDAMVDVGASIIADIALGIAGQLPSLIETATGFLVGFIEAISENLPMLMEAGGQIIGALASGIVQLAGQLIPIGWTIISTIIQGIVSRAPQLYAQAGKLLQQFTAAISTQLPQLVQQGTAALGQFVQGLLQNIPSLISSAGDIISQLYDAFLSALPQIMEAGIQLLGQLAQGILSNLPEAIGAAAEALIQIVATIASHMPEILQKGIELLGELAAGIIQAIPGLVGKIPEVITSVKDKFMEFDWLQIGRDIVAGIANGLKNSLGTIIEAAKSVGEAALNGLKGLLGIHSPSRVFRDEVGKNIALGIAEGIVGNKKYAKKSAEDIADAMLQAAKKRLDNTKVYQDMSLADEAAYWDAVRVQIKEGTQARIDADKEYLQAKKNLDNKMADLERDYADKIGHVYENLQKNIRDLQDTYRDEVQSRTKDIMRSMNLFDEFTATTEKSTADLIKNLKSQVNSLNEWSNNLQKLERRGVTGDMLDELRDLGVDAAGEIALMTRMSDSELNEYISLWKQKQRIASSEAQTELEPLLKSTQQQIIRMQQEAAAELEKYKQQYVDAMSEIGVEIQQPLQEIRDTLLSTVSEAVKLIAGTVSGEADDQGNVSQFAELAKSILDASSSLPEDFTGLGEDTITGMIQGLDGKSGELYAAMARIINETIQAAKETAEIHSPSRIMRDLIGRNMIAGIGVGFDMEADGLNDKASGIINGAVSSMQKASAKKFVSEMQVQSLKTSVGMDSTANLRYMPDKSESDGEEPRPIILEKGSIEVPVSIDGRTVAKVTAPYMDTELGKIKDKKDRG